MADVRLRRNVERMFEIATINASQTVSCGIINCDNTRTATFSARGTYNASATVGMTVNLYYSPDGEHYDTVPYSSFTVDLTAGSTIQESHIFDLPEHGFVHVKIANGDTTYTVTVVSLFYTVARWGDTYEEADMIVTKQSQTEKDELAEGI